MARAPGQAQAGTAPAAEPLKVFLLLLPGFQLGTGGPPLIRQGRKLFDGRQLMNLPLPRHPVGLGRIELRPREMPHHTPGLPAVHL